MQAGTAGGQLGFQRRVMPLSPLQELIMGPLDTTRKILTASHNEHTVRSLKKLMHASKMLNSDTNLNKIRDKLRLSYTNFTQMSQYVHMLVLTDNIQECYQFMRENRASLIVNVYAFDAMTVMNRPRTIEAFHNVLRNIDDELNLLVHRDWKELAIAMETNLAFHDIQGKLLTCICDVVCGKQVLLTSHGIISNEEHCARTNRMVLKMTADGLLQCIWRTSCIYRSNLGIQETVFELLIRFARHGSSQQSRELFITANNNNIRILEQLATDSSSLVVRAIYVFLINQLFMLDPVFSEAVEIEIVYSILDHIETWTCPLQVQDSITLLNIVANRVRINTLKALRPECIQKLCSNERIRSSSASRTILTTLIQRCNAANGIFDEGIKDNWYM